MDMAYTMVVGSDSCWHNNLFWCECQIARNKNRFNSTVIKTDILDLVHFTIKCNHMGVSWIIQRSPRRLWVSLKCDLWCRPFYDGNIIFQRMDVGWNSNICWYNSSLFYRSLCVRDLGDCNRSWVYYTGNNRPEKLP